MAHAVRAVAGGLAATEMREGQGAGEQIAGKPKTTYQFKLTLAEPRSLRTLRFVFHLIV
jgi:hypothetical protein